MLEACPKPANTHRGDNFLPVSRLQVYQMPQLSQNLSVYLFDFSTGEFWQTDCNVSGMDRIDCAGQQTALRIFSLKGLGKKEER